MLAVARPRPDRAWLVPLPCTWFAASRSLGECFQLFDVIHRITTTHEAIQRITREVGRIFVPIRLWLVNEGRMAG